jgi:hypothetical protein
MVQAPIRWTVIIIDQGRATTAPVQASGSASTILRAEACQDFLCGPKVDP